MARNAESAYGSVAVLGTALALVFGACGGSPHAETRARGVAQAPRPRSAAPAPTPVAPPDPPAPPGEVYFVGSRGELVRYADGTLDAPVPRASYVVDVAFARSGETYVLTQDGLFVLEDGALRAVPGSTGGYALAVRSDDVPVTLSSAGLACYEGARSAAGSSRARWAVTPMSRFPGTERDSTGEDPMMVVAGPAHATVLASVDQVFTALGGYAFEEFIGKGHDERMNGLASGPDGTVAAVSDPHVFRRAPGQSRWTIVSPLETGGVWRSVDVSADGTITVSAFNRLAIIPPSGSPTTMTTAELGLPDATLLAVARDARGLTWMDAGNALVVLSPSYRVLRSWPMTLSALHVRVKR